MATIAMKDGTQIYYKDWGRGQPIVFSHGWPLSADDWDGQMLFFGQRGYRVIAHDRRGHGRSTQTWDGNDTVRASEQRFRLIVDSIPGLVCTMTAAGEVELVNQQILDYTGKTLEQLKDWGPILHEEDRAHVIAEWGRSIQMGRPYDIEHRILGADGIHRWFHVRGLPLRDEEGRVVRWYILLSDITERKIAEDDLQQTKAYLLEAQRLSHTGSWKHDLSSGKVIVSPEIHQIFGIKPNEDSFSADLYFSRIHPEDRVRT